MRLTLRQLQIFHAIAQHGSTSAAALRVPLSQSATSAALNELERLLGVPLFDRIGKRLLLNDSGRTLLPLALAVLDGARSIETAFGSKDARASADLRVFASTTIGNYLLPRVLSRYREFHPRARLDVSIGNTLDVVTAVREFETDLGFIEGPCHESGITVVPWLEDELVIVAASKHALVRAANRGRLTPAQLMGATWLLREPGSGTREAVEQALLPYLPNIESTLTLGSSEAIKNAAAEGLGISCLSRAVVQDFVNSKRLTVLATSLPPLLRRFSLIHHRNKVLSPSLRGFMAFCQESRDRSRGRPRIGTTV